MKNEFEEYRFHSRVYFDIPPIPSSSRLKPVATPNVYGLQAVLASDSTVTVTNFLGGIDSQVLCVIGDGKTTIQSNQYFAVASDLLLRSGLLYIFVYIGPQQIWYISGNDSDIQPTTEFLRDTFTDTLGTVLDAHTGELGATWTEHPSYASSSILIGSSNDIYANFIGASEYYASGVPASADYVVQGTFRMLSSMFGVNDAMTIWGRGTTVGDNKYAFMWRNITPAWELYRVISGVYTLLGSSGTNALDTSNNRVGRLRMEGTTISAEVDGSTVISVTDANIAAAGRAGVRTFNNTAVSTFNSKLHLSNVFGFDL